MDRKRTYYKIQEGRVGRRRFLTFPTIIGLGIGALYIASHLPKSNNGSEDFQLEPPIPFNEQSPNFVDFDHAFNDLFAKAASTEPYSPNRNDENTTGFSWQKGMNEGTITLFKGLKPAENWPMDRIAQIGPDLFEEAEEARMIVYLDLNAREIFALFEEKGQEPKIYTTPPSQKLKPLDANRYLTGFSNLLEQNLAK